MTAIVALRYMEQNKIMPEEYFVTVSKEAASLKGTSAELEEGDIISLWNLLYGVMLPSGNDAAYCLAESIGDKILEEKYLEEKDS